MADATWLALNVVSGGGSFSSSQPIGVTKIAKSVIAPLADQNISVFMLSTYQTDFILVSQGPAQREIKGTLGSWVKCQHGPGGTVGLRAAPRTAYSLQTVLGSTWRPGCEGWEHMRGGVARVSGHRARRGSRLPSPTSMAGGVGEAGSGRKISESRGSVPVVGDHGTLTSLTPRPQVRERDLPFVTHTLSSEFTILRVVNGETVAAENLGITNGFVKPKMGELRGSVQGRPREVARAYPRATPFSEHSLSTRHNTVRQSWSDPAPEV